MRLLILNGPCGVGKSTVAEIIHTQLRGSVLVNLDTIRRFVSRHRERPAESHAISVALTTAMLKVCAHHGSDVIVDKMLYDDAVLDAFRETVQRMNGAVFEFLLWADKKTVVARSDKRGYRQNGLFTKEKCVLFWETMDDFRKKRKRAIVVDTTNRTPTDIATDIMARIAI